MVLVRLMTAWLLAKKIHGASTGHGMAPHGLVGLEGAISRVTKEGEQRDKQEEFLAQRSATVSYMMLVLVEVQEMAFLKLKRCTAPLNASRSALIPKDVKTLFGIQQIIIRILMSAGQREAKTTKQDKIVKERLGT